MTVIIDIVVFLMVWREFQFIAVWQYRSILGMRNRVCGMLLILQMENWRRSCSVLGFPLLTVSL